ncbi:MAG: carbohydrate porin [Planctomycetes bacterium]|nr:carbohydrate porin [Planctomycetota bacterium]
MKYCHFLPFVSFFIFSIIPSFAIESAQTDSFSNNQPYINATENNSCKRIDRLEVSLKNLENKVDDAINVLEQKFDQILKILETHPVAPQHDHSGNENKQPPLPATIDNSLNASVPEMSSPDLPATAGITAEPTGRLEKKISSMEETIKDIQNRASIMDMVEEVRRVQEYVCKNGHIYPTWGTNQRCPDCNSKQKSRDRFKLFKFARRESISERIASAVDEAFEKRIIIGASGTGILQQVLSSDKEEKGFASGSLDLLFIAKPFLHTTFLADLEAIGGDGPDEIFGSFSGLNDDSGSFQDDDGIDRVSVREIWLQSFLFDQRLKLVGGKIDLTNYFDSNTVANDETSQFITSAFVNNPTLEVPENGPGLVAFFDTKKGLNFGFGLQSADNSGTNITDEIYAIAELGYRSHLFFGRDGNYRIWGRMNGEKNDNKGFGISIDQNLSTQFTAFARYGANEEDEGDAEVASAWSAGLRYRSPFFSRVNDEIALAFGMLDIVGGSEESATELYYKFQLNEHFAISPNVQAIFDPAGVGSEDTALVAGIRTQIEF